MTMHTMKAETHVIVMEYEFELINTKNERVQHGAVDAGATHTSAAWAALAKAVQRPEQNWIVRVRRIGNQVVRRRNYVVERNNGKLSLVRIDVNA